MPPEKAELWSLLQERIKLRQSKEVSVTALCNIARSSPCPVKFAPALVLVSVTEEGKQSKGSVTFSVGYGLVCWAGESSSSFLGLSLVFSVL